MKKKNILALACLALLMACDNSGKNSVEIADSLNDAKRDSIVDNNGGAVADEKSADFLVRASNGGKAELEITTLAREKAMIAEVKNFASMLHEDHMALSAKITELAAGRNVMLPALLTDDKQKNINKLKEVSRSDFDKLFIRDLIDAHDASIQLFEKAVNEVKDADVRSFADNSLPKLRQHRDSASAILKRYW